MPEAKRLLNTPLGQLQLLQRNGLIYGTTHARREASELLATPQAAAGTGDSPGLVLCHVHAIGSRTREQSRRWDHFIVKMWQFILMQSLVAFAAVAMPSAAQSSTDSKGPSIHSAEAAPDLAQAKYTRPTESAKFHAYLFSAIGPLPVVMSSFTAGIHQWTDTPREWKQGFKGYSRRLGSDFAIPAVQNTTRYALAELTRENTSYYKCKCRGLVPRLGHAALATLTARAGADGHRVFSFPLLVAPYVGTTTAVYGWFPSRYNIKDAFRMGNYSVLGYMGTNISLEFIPRRAISLLAKVHLNNRHGAPDTGSQQ